MFVAVIAAARGRRLLGRLVESETICGCWPMRHAEVQRATPPTQPTFARKILIGSSALADVRGDGSLGGSKPLFSLLKTATADVGCHGR